MKIRRCSLCHKPGHDKRAHVRRNLAGSIYGAGRPKFHPYRDSDGYDSVLAGEFQNMTPGRIGRRLDSTLAKIETATDAYGRVAGTPDAKKAEKRLESLTRSAEQLDRYKREQEEKLSRELDGLGHQIGGLKDHLSELPRDLGWLIRKSGNLKGEIGSMPISEWNRRMPSFPAHRGMLNKAGRVEATYALDQIASERGYRDVEDMTRDAKRARKLQDQIEDLEREAGRVEDELRGYGARVSKRKRGNPARKAATVKAVHSKLTGRFVRRRRNPATKPEVLGYWLTLEELKKQVAARKARAEKAAKQAAKPKRRNLSGSVYGGKFHPYRGSKGYDRGLGGDRSKRSGR